MLLVRIPKKKNRTFSKIHNGWNGMKENIVVPGQSSRPVPRMAHSAVRNEEEGRGKEDVERKIQFFVTDIMGPPVAELI